MPADDGSREDLLSSLQVLVFGGAPKPSQAPPTEPSTEAKSGGNKSHRKACEQEGLIDTLGSRKLRKLHLSKRDLDNEDRLPTKRYWEKEEFAEAVAEKLAAPRSWLERAREKARTSAGAGLPTTSTVQLTSEKEIRKGDIRLRRLRDPTRSGLHEGRVTAVGFSKNQEVLWSTGADKTVKLYTLRGEDVVTNSSNIHIKKCPIWDAALGRQNKLYCVSDQASIFTLDLELKEIIQLPRLFQIKNSTFTIKKILTHDNDLIVLESSGRISHIDQRTNRLIRSYTSATSNTSIVFNLANPSLFHSGDKDGELFTWSLGEGRCISRRPVQGSLGIVNLAWSGPNRLMAAGESGLISMFDPSQLAGKSTLKAFSNLAEPASTLVGHPKAPICLAASNARQNAIKLINTREKGFVYQNWPGEKTIVKRVTAASFSENGRWMTIGNDHGAVRLWSIPDLECTADMASFT